MKSDEMETMLRMAVAMQTVGQLLRVLHAFPLEQVQDDIKNGRELVGDKAREDPTVRLADKLMDLTLDLVEKYRREAFDLIKQKPWRDSVDEDLEKVLKDFESHIKQ